MGHIFSFNSAIVKSYGKILGVTQVCAGFSEFLSLTVHDNNLYSCVNAVKLYKLIGDTCEVKGYIDAVPYGPIILKISNRYIYIYTHTYIFI